MAPKRMRYRWWTDIPRNVSRRDYDRLQGLRFGAIATGGIAVASLLMALTGQTLRSSEELSQIDAMTVAEARAYEGDRLDLIKVEGFLVADDAPTMPDDEALRVIRGEISLVARSNTASDEDTLQETLLEWQGEAEPVFVSDGEERIPLAVDLVQLPLPEADVEMEQEPDLERSGSSARTSRPTAVTYGGEHYPLDPETWGEVESVFTDLERRALPHGQAVVVVAGLEPTPDGNQLVDPLGDRLTVALGSEADIQAKGKAARGMFGVIWIPLAIASFFLSRSAHRLYLEFVEISNQG